MQPTDHQLQERRAVADRIRRLRHVRGLSQEGLAEAVGRDRQTIGQWERAATSPTVDDIAALAAALGVKTWEMFYR